MVSGIVPLLAESAPYYSCPILSRQVALVARARCTFSHLSEAVLGCFVFFVDGFFFQKCDDSRAACLTVLAAEDISTKLRNSQVDNHHGRYVPFSSARCYPIEASPACFAQVQLRIICQSSVFFLSVRLNISRAQQVCHGLQTRDFFIGAIHPINTRRFNTLG